MIVIATNNGKKYLSKLLESLEFLGNKIPVSIIDTQSDDIESLEYLSNLQNTFPFDIKTYRTPYRGFDTGAYIWAYRNIPSEKYYFLQDSLKIKSLEYFSETDKRLKPGTIVPLLTFENNGYGYGEGMNFCQSNFGTTDYDLGIFGPIFSILRSDMDKIDSNHLCIPHNKATQTGMERGWAIIFKIYGFVVDPLEGIKDDFKIENHTYQYFEKQFPYRK
jgi:hypothetical protein